VYDLAGDLAGGPRQRESCPISIFKSPLLLKTELGDIWEHCRSAVGGDHTKRRVLSLVGRVIFPFRAAMLHEHDNRGKCSRHAPRTRWRHVETLFSHRTSYNSHRLVSFTHRYPQTNACPLPFIDLSGKRHSAFRSARVLYQSVGAMPPNGGEGGEGEGEGGEGTRVPLLAGTKSPRRV
jgi:hypothetical protein